MTFGERLKELRKERGLSQMELCEAIAVSRQTLSKWENDVVLPDVENLVTLARYYGVSTDFLLGLTPDRNLEKTQAVPRRLWPTRDEIWLFLSQRHQMCWLGHERSVKMIHKAFREVRINRKKADVIFLLYTVAIILGYSLLFPRQSLSNATWGVYVERYTNLVPLRGIAGVFELVKYTGSTVYYRTLVGHLLLLVPMGILYGLVPEAAPKKIYLRSAIILVVLYAIRVGERLGSFDIDDILLNLVGLFLATQITRLWKHRKGNSSARLGIDYSGPEKKM